MVGKVSSGKSSKISRTNSRVKSPTKLGNKSIYDYAEKVEYRSYTRPTPPREKEESLQPDDDENLATPTKEIDTDNDNGRGKKRDRSPSYKSENDYEYTDKIKYESYSRPTSPREIVDKEEPVQSNQSDIKTLIEDYRLDEPNSSEANSNKEDDEADYKVKENLITMMINKKILCDSIPIKRRELNVAIFKHLKRIEMLYSENKKKMRRRR